MGDPNPLLDGIHDRMPVMLMPDDYDRWLDPTMAIDDLRAMLKPYDADLMKAYEVSRAVNREERHAATQPYDADLMHAYKVSRAVNGVKNDTPECVDTLTR